ncbi:PREDICTED: ankyrin repeat and LEM domain-containing protein 1 isoform X6 [Rhinopithecus bieti]|uniref:ankyrin repeat and LEM domain-containing protein 1 isoform X6 n=1 Tax=Rhinopithecus bieti TaxID=61621 RepID=UPI00083C4972|nr:PREDICTED: ankyrin repeat and LEM domain-containing protein 1 isoform X6 [Rhinopithecus bieti]
MWTPVRRGAAWLGILLTPGEGTPEPRGGAAHAHKPAAGSRKWARQEMRFGPRQGMCSEARLARRLRAALREEEPWAVEELLRCGADPNLVLEDGAAAVHLAAGARHPRGLRCLGALLRQGGDPNARSVEALTPLHVAAAWGCRRGLELLLSQGANPALRDQDGLRPLDLALQQGHLECARVLQDLDMRTRTRTRIGAETQESEAAPGTPGLSGSPDEMLDSIALQTQPCRGDNRDMGLEADAGPPSLPVPLEIVDKDGSSASPPGHWDYSSDASFITAVEVSGAEDPASDTPPWAGSLPPIRQGLLHVVHATQRVPRSQGTEAELNAHLQALTLTPPNAAGFQSSPSSMPLLDRSPAHSPPQTPPPGASDCHGLWEHQTSIDSDMATLWLTEDEASSTGGRDPVSSCQDQPVSIVSDLELLQGLQALGPEFSGHSLELAAALRTGCIPDVQADEDALAQQFEQPDPARRWREGVVKSSFTYLLLDPRETQDLPARAFSLTPAERLQTFVRAIFYVGKGTRARPYVHLWEALGHHGRSRKQGSRRSPTRNKGTAMEWWQAGHLLVAGAWGCTCCTAPSSSSWLKASDSFVPRTSRPGAECWGVGHPAWEEMFECSSCPVLTAAPISGFRRGVCVCVCVCVCREHQGRSPPV